MSEQIQTKPKNHNRTVQSIFGTNTTKGEVGIEIETIGKNLPIEFQKTKLWNCHVDHSIKPRVGEVGTEYTLIQPIGRAKVEQALEELVEEWAAAKAQVAEGRLSNSVHIHLNAQQLTMQQVYTWLALYFIFEEILVRWCGEDRVANLFCLRARDAEGLIKMLAQFAKDDSWSHLGSDNYRYAAVNTTALAKFGSLEFRSLRGTGKVDVIKTWIDTLLAIKDKSLEYKSPTEVLADFSGRSPIGITRNVLPDVMRRFAFSQPDFIDVLWDGARLAQDFAFSTEWQGRKVTEEAPRTKGKKYFTGNTVILDDTLQPGWVTSNNLNTWGVGTSPTPQQTGIPGHPSWDDHYRVSALANGRWRKSTTGVLVKPNSSLKNAYAPLGNYIGWSMWVNANGDSYALLALFNAGGALIKYLKATDTTAV